MDGILKRTGLAGRFGPTAIALLIATAAMPAPTHAASAIGDPATSDLTVNTLIAGDQDSPRLAVNARGDFVIAWRSRSEGGRADARVRAFRADGTPRSAEIRVDEFAAGAQRPAHVAINADGGFVVVWIGSTGSGNATFVRAFAADGTPLTPAAPAHTQEGHNGPPHDLRMDASGNFFVHWVGGDGDGRGIYMRGYLADGSPRAGEQRLNGETAGDQAQALVTPSAENGRFAVAWNDHQPSASGIGVAFLEPDGTPIRGSAATTDGSLTHVGSGGDDIWVVWTHPATADVHTRAYHVNGTTRIGETLVNTFTTGLQAPAGIAVNPVDGDSVFIWRSEGEDGSGDGAYARAFNGNGSPRTPAFRVGTQVAGAQVPTHVGMDAASNFVIVWQGPDGSSSGVYAAAYDADGVPRTAEVRVNTNTGGQQVPVQLAVTAGGGFVVLWHNLADSSVRARAFQPDGAPASGEFAVAGGGEAQTPGPAALDADGDLLVTWSEGPTDDSGDVHARRFAGFEPVDLALALTDTQDPVEPGQAFGYVLGAGNEHPGAADPAVGLADGVVVTGTLPPGSLLTGYEGADWTCSEDAGSVQCALGVALAPGAQSSVTLDVVAPPGLAPIQATASIRGQQLDAQVDNDDAFEATQLVDVTPDPFTFASRRNMPPGIPVRSQLVTITGLGDAEAPISIAGDPSALYSINDAPYRSAASTIRQGDELRLRLIAGPLAGPRNERRMTVTVGSYTTGFVVRTLADPVPDAFEFTDRIDRPADDFAVSTPQVLTGFTMKLRATLAGDPSCRLRVAGGAWERRARVEPGQSVQLRLRTAATAETARTCTLSLGGVTDDWSVTTSP